MRSVYLSKKAKKQPQVSADDLPKYLALFQNLNDQSSNQEILEVLQFLSNDDIITHDLTIKFFELSTDIPQKLYTLIHCDYTYQFISEILVIYFSETNFLKHLKRIDFRTVTIYQEHFLMEMFSLDDILLKYVFQIDLKHLFLNRNFELLNFISLAINSHTSLRFSNKQHEIDCIFGIIEQSRQYETYEFSFIETLISDVYNDRIFNFIKTIPGDKIYMALQLLNNLDSEIIDKNAEMLFNIALISLEKNPFKALKLLQMLLYHQISYENYENNFNFIVQFIDVNDEKIQNQMMHFLISFIEIFSQIKMQQIQVLVEDFNIIQLIIKAVTRLQSKQLELAIQYVQMISLLINCSQQQMDIFIEQRYDVLEVLCDIEGINYCDDFLSLRDEFYF